MAIVRRRFPQNLLVFPSKTYWFGSQEDAETPFKVIASFQYPEAGTVHLTAVGAIGFEFPDSGDLASIDVLRSTENGQIPDAVMQNSDLIAELQQRRQLFMNFTAAALLGKICADKNMSLYGAEYCTLDKFFTFNVSDHSLQPELHPSLRRVLAARNMEEHRHFVDRPNLDRAIAFMDQLSDREALFEHADIRACMAMNYQAAILHSQQHAAASLALNVSVMETLVWEIFLAFGLVGERTPQSFCVANHTLSKISNNKFRDMTFNNRLEALREGGMVGPYLHERAERARLLRNDLMHKGQVITPSASGECQTAVRDLWFLLLNSPFELNAGWSYRT